MTGAVKGVEGILSEGAVLLHWTKFGSRTAALEVVKRV